MILAAIDIGSNAARLLITEVVIDEKGFTVDNVPEDLSAVLMADKDEEESDENDD